MPAASDFSLAAPAFIPAKIARGHYLQPLKFYAAIYGYDPSSGERTIKRFVSLGRHSVPPDLPPLDAPLEMADWWRAHHPGRSLPGGIRRAGEKPRVTPPASSPLPAPAPALAPASSLDFSAQVAGIRSNCDHDRRALETLKSQTLPADLDLEQTHSWQAAHDTRIEAAQRQYARSFEMLRKAENDLLDWEKTRALLVPRNEVASEITRIVTAIHASGLRLVRTLRPLLAEKTPDQQDTTWQEEWRKCFRILAAAKFTHDPFALDA